MKTEKEKLGCANSKRGAIPHGLNETFYLIENSLSSLRWHWHTYFFNKKKILHIVKYKKILAGATAPTL